MFNSLLVCILLATLFFGCNTLNTKKSTANNNSYTYELVEDWPQLPADFILGNPTGIGVDSLQNIFVFHRAGRLWTDPMPDSVISAKTIVVLDKNTGKIIDSWGENIFIMPHGLTIDKENNIWLTDVGLHQVFKFSPNGKLLMTLGEARVSGKDSAHFNLPTDVAIAADGSFYVSDGYGNSRVVKFSPTGKYLFEWGSFGNQQGQFNVPHGIDLDADGNVYVADRENSRIQRFTPDGRFITQWDNLDSGYIYSVVLDKTKNNLIATDYLKINNTTIKGSDVLIIDLTNNITNRFGKSGLYSGPVCRYHDVTIDKEHNIYVGDILGNRIQKFKLITR